MHSRAVWNYSKSPNYETNTDKKYPYSEVPYIGQYNLVKIPIENELIELVDYWGEGRIITELGNSGFADCYNVNHEYQLVSNGNDKNSKIPNRVPVISYIDCDTSSYIKDNSVKTVALMGSPINKSCATDIARIVNIEEGKVIVYGFEENEADIKNLEEALNKRGLSFCVDFEVADLFKTLTLFDKTRTYLNGNDMNRELVKSIANENYGRAVKLTKALNKNICKGEISKVVLKLIEDGKRENVIYFGNELIKNDGKDITDNFFPEDIRLMFGKTAAETYSTN